MKVYIGERNGVHNQGITGVFSTQDKAVSANAAAKELEPDDYHEFTVTAVTVDVIIDLDVP